MAEMTTAQVEQILVGVAERAKAHTTEIGPVDLEHLLRGGSVDRKSVV